MMSGEDRGSLRTVGQMGGVGLLLGMMTLVGALVGRYLDERWGTAPWLTLTGTLCGMGLGFFEVVSLTRRISKD